MQNTTRLQQIGFEQARTVALSHMEPLGAETIPISNAVGRIAAEPVRAAVDSPSVDASLKDGYAVISTDVASAGASNPIRLRVMGVVAAGDETDIRVHSMTAARILSGGRIPQSADAVLSEEFTLPDGDSVLAFADAHPGRNILRRGTEVAAGERLVDRGRHITPGTVSRLVAGGTTELQVYRRPRIALLATGSEVLLPGTRLKEGQLYASNLALQAAWLGSLGIDAVIGRSGDSFDDLCAAASDLAGDTDALVTSGGAWTGDRDLIIQAFDSLGWEMLFHRVRIGPGKAVGMGILNDKPVFCLPGGPPSNETAFLTIVLPALMRMAGSAGSPFLRLSGRLMTPLKGQIDWTQFIRCRIHLQGSEYLLEPLDMARRLESMAAAEALVAIPEGTERIDAGTVVGFSCLDTTALMKGWEAL